MEFEYKTSDEYHRGAAAIEESVRKGPPVSYEQYLQLTILKESSEVLAAVEAVTGMKFNVIKSGPAHLGGMADLNRGEVFISEDVLKKYRRAEAVKIGGHESNHQKTRISALEVTQELGKEAPKYLEVIKKVVGKNDIENVFLVEGFNEFLTERDFGRNENCKYNEDEVPAAKKLERLSLLLTGQSLLSAYEAGEKPLFFRRLKVLCEMLIVREKIDGAMAN